MRNRMSGGAGGQSSRRSLTKAEARRQVCDIRPPSLFASPRAILAGWLAEPKLEAERRAKAGARGEGRTLNLRLRRPKVKGALGPKRECRLMVIAVDSDLRGTLALARRA